MVGAEPGGLDGQTQALLAVAKSGHRASVGVRSRTVACTRLCPANSKRVSRTVAGNSLPAMRLMPPVERMRTTV